MNLFKGSGVAMITPFNENGVAYGALDALIEHLIGGGTSALFVLGTTGEPSTMTEEERREVVRFTVGRARGRVPVYVGTGSNCTAEAVRKSAEAERVGADGLLVVTPYYNKCTQGGLVEHYRAVANAVGIPVFAYNVPGRTGVNIAPETALRLAEIPNMAALKEASGNIDQIQEIARVLSGTDMVWYSGDDSLTAVTMLLGARGVISVAANVVPRLIADLTGYCLAGQWDKARDLQLRLAPFMKALFCEVNPIPVKKAVQLVGIDAGTPRLPLTEMEPAHAETLREVMRSLNVIA